MQNAVYFTVRTTEMQTYRADPFIVFAADRATASDSKSSDCTL